MELRATLSGLARRFPDLALAVDPDDLAWRGLSAVYGVDALPVHLRGATAGRRPVLSGPSGRAAARRAR